ncbi:hypothetical protein [Mesorhizobium sp. WSM2239]|uniref:Uncharacterized protein n=2 Tax=unclassified Mesorhizobium TaxID=325217 RepID=A0AAU8DCB0_9HYPH
MNTVANEVGTRLALTPKRMQSAGHVPADQPRAEHFKRSATLRNFAGGLAALFLVASPLHAGELSAMAGESIDLGRFHGVLYYTSVDDGYQLVATIADGEAAPVRFRATLAENQSATISVPGKLGEPGQSLEISRSGDKLTLNKGPISNDLSDQETGAITK